MPQILHNPILSGCYPDPSICRVGEDYYLVTSTFEYFPGLPIFHSRDLINWRQIGHVLDRASQLDLDGIRPSGGLYAPTIRHYDGTFYVINTLVDGKTGSGNFIVTATQPQGPWSEPYWLDADGIDPSLFFDDDGKCWYVGTRLNEEGYYTGHTEIFLQELDLEKMKLVGNDTVLWDGAVKGVVWAESPHIYKANGYYYLMIAEAGTAHHHAITIARSKNIAGPYEGNKGNPILTHRHLGLDYPIVGTGHADLVETQNGELWLVLLAMRPYGGYFYNLGRETFLVPTRWEDDWLIVSPGTGRVEFEYPAPNLPEHIWNEAIPAKDDFNDTALAYHWNFLRTPREEFYSLSERPGFLHLKVRPQKLSEQSNASFVGRRQQHMDFTAQTAFEFAPGLNEQAGLALVQSTDFHYLFVVTLESEPVLRLIKRAHGKEETLAEQPVSTGQYNLKVTAHGQDYNFYFSNNGQWQTLAENVDGRILSTPVAGGFVGAWIGMYASSNGQPSKNHADFDWFEYMNLDGN
ncbi:MAG: glycoside hydrolase family 43 protein [Chloroflexota bacterium]